MQSKISKERFTERSPLLLFNSFCQLISQYTRFFCDFNQLKIKQTFIGTRDYKKSIPFQSDVDPQFQSNPKTINIKIKV